MVSSFATQIKQLLHTIRYAQSLNFPILPFAQIHFFLLSSASELEAFINLLEN
jgi:hypothetical protein